MPTVNLFASLPVLPRFRPEEPSAPPAEGRPEASIVMEVAEAAEADGNVRRVPALTMSVGAAAPHQGSSRPTKMALNCERPAPRGPTIYPSLDPHMDSDIR